ncbi:MAG: pyrrolysine--tRNA(Pyl) ligase large subunit [Firmicutes bacterium]|nr:pyrrolysine--tRNA(Pyl) ligase large subunit [Bacillota bacterium]MBQ6608309.1 pyrrolysine--tRNA(Pyl) ligase large subunit [Bacillota bacterium]MBR3184434.1 pyrrolysine--tRNA(Pyl) ligase large subunit [Bacillota bacterium]MBR3260897.1 pyrrolysine--tRNA(Pyl) ligase large subunit [Bacillota bacterium]
MEKYTVTQSERLNELNAPIEEQEREFETKEERNEHFRKLEKELTRYARNDIFDLLESRHMTKYRITGNKMADWLMEEGFTEVITPTIISRDSLKKMGIDSGSQFLDQVFWVDGKHCLRPMLAPNLYVEMRELLRITKKPVKIFEMGSCFRKESQGAQHLNEFTMLNLVELAAVKDGEQLAELERLALNAMEALGLKEGEYEFVQEDSEVYGKVSFDILINGMEVASGSYGPHFLDANWGVFDTWVGIGFGIERLTMALDKGRTIKRYGRTLSFIDGEPLNI